MPEFRFHLEVEPVDLGRDVRAVWLKLTEWGGEEPARGPEAVRIWAAALPALAGADAWVLDFFSHLDRVRDFCRRHEIAWREVAARALVIDAPDAGPLGALLERFEGELFGARAGGAAADGDSALENDLARRGGDAYHHAYKAYSFCAVCDLSTGYVTLLTEKLSSSEVLRRVRPALASLAVDVLRPK